MYKVYEISSSKSDKFYIGVTHLDIRDRLYYHIHCPRSNPKKNSWIKKYGDNIRIIALADNLSENDAYSLEIKLINTYRNLYGKNKILNFDNGGRGGRAGIKTSLQTRIKQSKVRLGRKLPETQRIAIANNRPGKKPVLAINIETNVKIEYPSQKQAAKALGLDESSVRRVLSGRYKYTGKYRFERKL